MTLTIKRFDELTLDELYSILRLRAEVFVIEQDCPYQDVDGGDMSSMHVLAKEGGEVLAYLRVYQWEDGNAAIGRVVTSRKVRGTGAGRLIMEEGVRLAHELYPGRPVVIHAQAYAVGFYEKFGFRVSSGEFLEDGIPHHEMTLK